MTTAPTPDPLDAIDQRGRAAAAGVRSALAERPVPVFDADLLRIEIDAPGRRRPRSRPVVALLAAAAAVLVVVAAVVALAGSGDDDSTPADPVAPGAVQRYLLSDVPRGFALAQIVDVGTPMPVDALFAYGPMAVYGPDATQPALGVFTIPDDGVDGRLPSLVSGQSRVETGPDQRKVWDLSESLGVDALAVEVDDDAYVAVVAAERDGEVDRVLQEIVVSGDRATVPAAALPVGWAHLGEAPAQDAFASIAGLAAEPDGETWRAAYGRPRGTGQQELIVVSSATGASLRVWTPRLDPSVTDAEEVEVRGHRGLLTRHVGQDGVAGLTVTWEERPGEIVQVIGLDTLGRPGLLELAEGVVVARGDEVPALREEALEAGIDDPGVTVVGEGTFTTGHRWVLTAGPAAGELLLRTSAAAMSSHQFQTGDDTEGPQGTALGGSIGYSSAPDVAWAYGLIGEDVAAVEVRGADGVVVEAVIVEGAGRRGWVAQLPPGPSERVGRYDVSARDGDGAVLATFTISS